MKETLLSSALVKAIRTAMPGAVVWKLQDKFAGGRPDILVIWNGRVAAIEAKVERPGRKAKREPLQMLTLQRMALAGAEAWWLVYWWDGKAVLEKPDTSAIAVFEPGVQGWTVNQQVARFVADALQNRYTVRQGG